MQLIGYKKVDSACAVWIFPKHLKDTVVVAPNERVRLLLDFADYTDPDSPYMYHCHNLEHGDAGMMGQFVAKAWNVFKSGFEKLNETGDKRF